MLRRSKRCQKFVLQRSALIKANTCLSRSGNSASVRIRCQQLLRKMQVRCTTVFPFLFPCTLISRWIVYYPIKSRNPTAAIPSSMVSIPSSMVFRSDRFYLGVTLILASHTVMTHALSCHSAPSLSSAPAFLLAPSMEPRTLGRTNSFHTRSHELCPTRSIRNGNGVRMPDYPRQKQARSLGMSLAVLPTSTKLATLVATPDALFNTIFVSLGVVALLAKVLDRDSGGASGEEEKPPAGVRKLQAQFLVVFWLLRMADWLQGPYFYEVYASKIISGQAVSLDMVSKLFLVGFGTTGLLGPTVGKLVDSKGRRLGTLFFCALYAFGALSTKSSLLWVLFLGRLAGGVGTSLLFSAPESWLVGEHSKGGYDGKWLSQTFGWAYAGDSLVAIAAGQIAAIAATARGPVGPFEVSVGFLAVGALIAALKWRENVAPSTGAEGPTIAEAWAVMLRDKKILLVGAVQSLFEGAMYIFVLQWPPSLIATLGAGQVPFGTVFSCFMASCLLGSTAFSALAKRGIPVEKTAAGMLAAAAVSMGVATGGGGSLPALVGAFLVFEACVGFYFPAIGTLRSRYLPESHRSVIVNIFGIPLNLIVVSVFLSINFLGVSGALACSTAALSLAAAAQFALLLTDDSPPPALPDDAPKPA